VAVPNQVEKLLSLRILDLTNNCITDDGLPMCLSRLPHLRAIGLKKNALTTVPRVLGYMHSLQEIYLEDNLDLEARPPFPVQHAGCRLREASHSICDAGTCLHFQEHECAGFLHNSLTLTLSQHWRSTEMASVRPGLTTPGVLSPGTCSFNLSLVFT
jgi:hypothetical protein